MAYQMYVSLQGDHRIVRFVIDPETGSLEPNGMVEIPGGPAPLTFNPTPTALYVWSLYGLFFSRSSLAHNTRSPTPPGACAFAATAGPPA